MEGTSEAEKRPGDRMKAGLVRQRGRQRRRERGRRRWTRRRGRDCTLSTAFCGPLCRCHQLFPCTEGSRAWNIASGPILGHLSSVNQTGGVGGERGRRTGRGGCRRKGWGGFCGTAKGRGGNRLGSGHCPENGASNLPLIKPPLPAPPPQQPAQ